MKMLHMIAAATIAVAGLAVPAVAQGHGQDRGYHDRGRHDRPVVRDRGRHYGRARVQCRTVYRHHRRVRVCR